MNLKALSTQYLQRQPGSQPHVNRELTRGVKNQSTFEGRVNSVDATFCPAHQQQATADSTITLWRRFILEADRVHRSSPKSTDAWKQHKEHMRTAMELCRAGDIPAARLELKKTLAALQSATITQPVLADTTTTGTKEKPVSPYCPASGCWCSARLPEHMDPSPCRNCPPKEYPPGGREAGA